MNIYKWMTILLLLILTQAACNLPLPFMTRRVETVTVMPSMTVAPVLVPPSETPLPTSSPTLLPVVPSPTFTSLPTLTFTPTILPSSTPTLSPTPTGTPTSEAFFSDLRLSTQVIFPGCDPKAVHFDVAVKQPGTFSVILFFRVRYKSSGELTSWNEGVVMLPNGDRFIYDLKALSIRDFNQFKEPVAWVQFQMVATDMNHAILSRSEVFTDRLTISSLCP